jgi:hypothetical protein
MSKTSFKNLRATLGAVSLLLAGCPDNSGPADSDIDMRKPTVDLGCYATARTHIELMNACTAAQSVDKQPVLPLLHSDGTLPPLP